MQQKLSQADLSEKENKNQIVLEVYLWVISRIKEREKNQASRRLTKETESHKECFKIYVHSTSVT